MNIKTLIFYEELQCHHGTLHPQHITLHSQDSMKKLAFCSKHNDVSEMMLVKYVFTDLFIQTQTGPLAPTSRVTVQPGSIKMF